MMGTAAGILFMALMMFIFHGWHRHHEPAAPPPKPQQHFAPSVPQGPSPEAQGDSDSSKKGRNLSGEGMNGPF